MTKKIVFATVVTGAITVGVIYIINRLNKKHGANIILDFAEYALGG